MALPTQAQVNTILRYAGTAVGTVASFGAVLGVLTPDQSAALVADVKAVIDDMTKLFGDVSKLVLFILPIATIWLGKIGYSSASPDSQKKSVASIPNTMVVETSSVAATIKTANTIAAIPEVNKVTAPLPVSSATPSNKVVS